MSEFDTQKDKYVTFQSGSEYFGLKIEYVNEIIVFQEITEIPESPEYVKGLINPIPYTDRTCIIVIRYEQMVVGLIVEKIAEVVEIPAENILPSPSIGKNDNAKSRFVSGIGKVGNDVKLLLDPAKLLGDEEAALVGHLNNEDESEEGEE